MAKILYIEEHQQIYDAIVTGDHDGALVLLETLDEMSRQTEINKIHSQMQRLLMHLIKGQVQSECGSGSWFRTINGALKKICWTNRLNDKGAMFISNDTSPNLYQALELVYNGALKDACLEMKDYTYTPTKLNQVLNKDAIISNAIQQIVEYSTT